MSTDPTQSDKPLTSESTSLAVQRPEADAENGINQQLLAAALNGDLAAVRRLLAASANIEARDSTIRRILERDRDSKWSRPDSVQWAKEQLAHDDIGNTPLMRAACAGHADVVAALLQAGAAVNALNAFDQESALTKAAWCDNPDVLRLLLDAGADVHHRNFTGDTALLHAAFAGDEAASHLLIERGADVNARNERGETALLDAARNNAPQTVRLLLAHGADPNAADQYGETPLMRAACSHEPYDGEIAQILIDAGADIHATDDDGKTALVAAASVGATPILRILLDMGEDPHAVDQCWGRSLLALSAWFAHTDAVAFLLERGVDINAADDYGDTALHLVVGECFKGCKECTRFLLEHGANPNAKNKKGQTPLAIAMESGLEELVTLLRNAGATQ